MTATVRYYTAPWCIPCKTFGPIMEEVFEHIKQFVKIEKIDVQEYPEKLPADVLGIPTVIVAVDEESKEIGRFSGAKSKSDVIQWLRDTLNSDPYEYDGPPI